MSLAQDKYRTAWPLSSLPNELEDIESLERILKSNPTSFVDPSRFRNAMLRSERSVACIEHNGESIGTGFLIGPDLMITNNHVRKLDEQNSFDSCPALVTVRFGYVEANKASSKTYALAEKWLVAESPTDDLDYCIFRISEEAGLQRIGDSPAAPIRGWIEPTGKEPEEGQVLSILQHPFGEPIKFAQGSLSKIGNGWFDYQVNTSPGSSGSPVFDANWNCIALHSRAARRTNRGKSFQSILNSLEEPVRNQLEAPDQEFANEEFSAVFDHIEPYIEVDFFRFTDSEIEKFAGQILRSMQAKEFGKSIGLRLARGTQCEFRLSEFAADSTQRLALRGSVDLLATQRSTLRDDRIGMATRPTAAAWQTIIEQKATAISATIDDLAERLDLLVDVVKLKRSE